MREDPHLCCFVTGGVGVKERTSSPTSSTVRGMQIRYSLINIVPLRRRRRRRRRGVGRRLTNLQRHRFSGERTSSDHTARVSQGSPRFQLGQLPHGEIKTSVEKVALRWTLGSRSSSRPSALDSSFTREQFLRFGQPSSRSSQFCFVFFSTP